jgi:hypothetical protein
LEHAKPNDPSAPKLVMNCAVAVYKLVEKNWESIDEGRSKFAIYRLLDSHENRASSKDRFVALSCDGRFVINQWIGKEFRYKRQSHNFFVISFR